MKKFAIGLIAAALGASSALAAQAPANYSAALSSPSRDGVVARHKSTAQLRSTSRRNGSVSVAAGSAETTRRTGIRSSYDKRLDATTFLWADTRMKTAALLPVRAQKLAETAARDYLARQAAALKLSKQIVADARVTSVHDTGRGPIVTRFKQFHDGIEVFGQNLNVLMGRDLKLVATSGYFAPASAFDKTARNAESLRGGFAIGAEQALAKAFADFGRQTLPPSTFTARGTKGAYTSYTVRATGGEIRPYGTPRAKQVWYYSEGRLTPGWYVELGGRSVDLADDYRYSYVISAADGAVLFRKSLAEEAVFSYNVFADPSGLRQPFDGPIGNDTAPYAGVGVDSGLPRIAATPNLVTLDSGPISTLDPWLADGATATVGNNVDAYLDLVADDGLTPLSDDRRATVNGASTFSFPYLPDTDPVTDTQRSHAVTHLFYVNNWLHDWWYDNGYDEAAGNSQASNYGRGGVEGDVMLVEAQDYSARNNANQSTPADGGSPRQQMFIFDGPVDAELTVAAPIGSLEFNTASFGAQVFDVTGTVVAAAPLDGCTALANGAAIAGNIAIIDRGACNFALKALNAQLAGAIGVIIANNTAGAAPGLGGDDPAVTIGALSVSQADGNLIRAALPTSARLRRAATTDIDGTLDTQIVAHEWFHTTSNRLVGDASGLSNQVGRGLGEGWSDFAALLLTVRPEDVNVSGNDRYQGAYPLAVYATLDSYHGIRRAPYSTNLDIFPFTFRHISDGVALPTNAPILTFDTNSQVHNTGSIWANVLWEFYASLLNDPRYSFEQARERMKDYVIAGLKMTPNAPTMLEARDAILAAALATDADDFNLAAIAFAKRGMGVGAVAPDRNSATNQEPDAIEDYTAFAGRLVVTEASLDFAFFDGEVGFIDNDGVLDPGETALLTVSLVNTGNTAITDPVTAALSSDGDLLFRTTAQRNAGTAGSGTAAISFPASDAAPIAVGATVTGTVEVTLASATGTAVPVTVTLAFPDVGALPEGVVEPTAQTITLDVNYDLVAARREVDDLEQPQAAVVDWGRALIGDGDGWEIVDGDLAPFLFDSGNLWSVPDNASPSDVRLTTPDLQVDVLAPGATASGPFTMSFSHYFQFEFAGVDAGGTAFGFDGGVIEVSSDGGATWQDVIAAGGSFTGGGGYSGLILALEADGSFAPTGAADPAPGFVGDNFGANGGLLETVTLTLPDSYAGQTVRFRFRAVSDTSVGDFGWSIDNVSFTGITNPPFSAVVAEDAVADNAAPVAVAGDDRTVAANAAVTLDGSGSSDDVGIVSHAWAQTAGPTVTLSGANTAIATFTPTEPGDYTFSLTVTDVRAATGSDSVTVIVNAPPVAAAGDDARVLAGQVATLDGSGSTDDVGVVSYAWTQTSGPAVALSGADTALASFTPAAAGTYGFSLTVTDVRGATGSDTVTVTAVPPPVARAGADQTTRPFRNVQLDGRGSTASATGSTLSYAWSQVGGQAASLSGANTATPRFVTGKSGAYAFSLTVTDSLTGATSTDTVTVNATVPRGGAFGLWMLLPGLVAVWLRRRRGA